MALSGDNLHIDERNHERVPTIKERVGHALLSATLGFALINIIGFWIFPGLGLGAIYMLPTNFTAIAIAGNLTTVIVYTVLALCFVFGWFRGQYFTRRLKHYINFWKFW